MDVEHVVIFMQENRAFDHYFGALDGVRGFADRFPIPVPDAIAGRHDTVWSQLDADGRTVSPFHLDTHTHFNYMRVEGTPHTWSNAQEAWDLGRMNRWPRAKHAHSMAYFSAADLPLQYALANAFTLCDAYHCSFMGGTNTNRLFLWTGTNDGRARHGGPAVGNTYNALDGGSPEGAYTWTTYPERLERAGISWQVYQDMDDNYSLNPLAGFKAYRDAYDGASGAQPELARRALSTRGLDQLRADVLANALPQVSWICATQAGSEHPSVSSPAQGADYTSHVLDALTANPAVWARTVLLMMFDENDGFFDHSPPPAPPARMKSDASPATLAGASTVDTAGMYHDHLRHAERDDLPAYAGLPYGLGARVPMYVISPWSKGGWVNSQVFDHTSVLQFLERRFGVHEPNIAAWRRAVCGDLLSAFDFSLARDAATPPDVPATGPLAARAAALKQRTTPPIPTTPATPEQAMGVRGSRALPYALHVQAHAVAQGLAITFRNTGLAGAVFHVYDMFHLERAPRRYTVGPGAECVDHWDGLAGSGAYDLWVLAPNGFHRQLTGRAHAQATSPSIDWSDTPAGDARLTLVNPSAMPCTFDVTANAYTDETYRIEVPPGNSHTLDLSLTAQGGWYDYTVEAGAPGQFGRRLAGRVETGRDTITDPAMAGPAIMRRTAPGTVFRRAWVRADPAGTP